MNQLPIDKRTQIINLLVEGSSLRAASRISGCSINTITKLLVDVGHACMAFHDGAVQKVVAQRVQCDEIWSFVYAKEKNVPANKQGQAGDIWTWTAIDADSKLILSWFVGDRSAESAITILQDVSSRVVNKMQLSTDGLKAYMTAVDKLYDHAGIQFSTLAESKGAISVSCDELIRINSEHREH